MWSRQLPGTWASDGEETQWKFIEYLKGPFYFQIEISMKLKCDTGAFPFPIKFSADL